MTYLPGGGGSGETGAWVTATVEDLDSAVTLTHNLGITVPGDGSCNVSVSRYTFEHNGASTGQVFDGTEDINAVFQEGDSVTTNAVEMRFYASGNRRVDFLNPITASLFLVEKNA